MLESINDKCWPARKRFQRTKRANCLFCMTNVNMGRGKNFGRQSDLTLAASMIPVSNHKSISQIGSREIGLVQAFASA